MTTEAAKSSAPKEALEGTQVLNFAALERGADILRVHDVKEAVLQSRYRSYPVLDDENRVVGTLSRYHLLQPQRKRIILVDHNEVGQSVSGLDEAELVGIIDHHRLGDVQTGYPVFVRNEPVGSTNTIVGTMFQEHGLMPGAKMAGLMAAAILSDTDLAGHALGISQITTMDSAAMIRRKNEFLPEMEKLQKEKGYDMVLLMITDVLKEGTELLFLGDREVIRQAFNSRKVGERSVFLRGVVSRKKQVVPALSQIWG